MLLCIIDLHKMHCLNVEERKIIEALAKNIFKNIFSLFLRLEQKVQLLIL
jgi:hypothetical protein